MDTFIPQNYLKVRIQNVASQNVMPFPKDILLLTI